MGPTRSFVPLGEIMTPAIDPHRVDPEAAYPNIGIYSFGRGIFRKPPIVGSTSSASTLYRVRAGQFIYSRLFAFEGAYGIVPAEADGAFVSNEFPAFDIDQHRTYPGYLGWLFRVPAVWRALAEKSVGMGDRRKRVKPETVLAHRIALPPIQEQRRLVAKIDRVAALTREARQLMDIADGDTAALLERAEREVWPDNAIASGEPLDVVTTFLSRGRQSKQGDSDHFLIKSQHVQMGFYRPTELTLAPWVADKVNDEARVQDGDVLIACSAAGCLGRVALFKADGRIASTDTHVAIARADRARLLPEYLFAYLRSAVGQHQLRSREQGSLGRERTGFRLAELNLRDLRQVPVPVPSIEEQRRILAEMGAIRTKLGEAGEHRAAIRTDLDLLLRRLLRDVFAGTVGAKHHLEDRSAA